MADFSVSSPSLRLSVAEEACTRSRSACFLQRQVIAILTGQDLQGCTEFLTEKLDQITAVFVKGFPVKKEIRRYKRQEKARLWLDCRRPARIFDKKFVQGIFHTVREHAKIRIFRRKRANVKQTGNIVGILIKKDAVSGGIPENIVSIAVLIGTADQLQPEVLRSEQTFRRLGGQRASGSVSDGFWTALLLPG